MKLSRIMALAFTLVLLAAFSAAAQKTTATGTTTPDVNAQMVRTSTIIGSTVEDPNGLSLGQIKDVVIDRATGQVAYAVLNLTGMPNAPHQLYAVPWKTLRTGTTATTLSMNITRSKLEKAPGFSEKDWPNLANRSYGNKIFQYYGVQPYWEQQPGMMQQQPGTNPSNQPNY